MMTEISARIAVILAICTELSLGFSECPEGWIYNYRNARCYQFNHFRKCSWEVALANCRLERGDLLSYENQGEKDWVLKNMVVNFYWSGLNDRYEDGRYVWTDHTEYNATLVHWAPREPNNWGGNEDCAVAISNGDMNDMSCDWNIPYICKRRPKVCPAGWLYCGVTGMCYQFNSRENVKKTWSAALEDCEQKGANLLSYQSMAEKYWVLSKMKSSAFWCGLNDLQTDGKWIWSDDTPYDAKIVNWAPGEPNNWGGNEDCAIVIGNAQMNDLSCEWKLPYICKGPRGTKNTSLF
ncbi:C-type mannose receptor 2 [Lingula anatina]|uniref:C-type mannose receptor 2 n=1 Tax=Lingula anatina TaxID=7574 RepID=A0A1S3IFS4_LINAN|nr:C-type mannose receptor 2 [Lingula anatina]|eukprot:XP_013396998.1 C-type mannose receptor 2 [Lingula anatina]